MVRADAAGSQVRALHHAHRRKLHNFIRRLILAARLNPWIYKEVEYDPHALWQSVLVVLLSCAASWIGITGHVRPFLSLGMAAFFGVLAWVLWTALAFVTAVKFFPECRTKATWGELLRTTAFATGPGILAVSGILPALTGLAPFVTDIWILVAFVVAVKRAFSYKSVWRAAAVCLIGWGIYAAAIVTIH